MPDKYQKWRSKLPKGLQWEGDYNLRGLYNSNPNATPSGNLHFPDAYKLGNHPTYSTQSQGWYNQPWLAGQWSEQPNGPMMNDVYTPFDSAYKQQLVEPHQFKQGGTMPQKNKALPVKDKNDPRYKAYMDTLNTHNKMVGDFKNSLNNGYHPITREAYRKLVGEQEYQGALYDSVLNLKENNRRSRLYFTAPNNSSDKNWITKGVNSITRWHEPGEGPQAWFIDEPPVQPYYIQGTIPNTTPSPLATPPAPKRKPIAIPKPLSINGNVSATIPSGGMSRLDIPDIGKYRSSPTGEPVYAQGGENMPLLGYYNSQEGFIPDTTNPDSQQYLQNQEYMQNLIRRNYGTNYEKKRDGGKMKKFSGKKGEYGLGIKSGDTVYPTITDMQQLQANPMQMMQIQQANQQLQPLPEQYNPNIPISQNQGAQRQQNKPWGFTTPGTGSLIAGAVGLANAVMPYDDGRVDRKRQYGGYNPYSQGIAGSQAIYADGGKIKGKKAPIYVESKNDPRYKAYQDSLGAYNMVQKELQQLSSDKNENSVSKVLKKPREQWKAGIQEDWIKEQFTSKYPNIKPDGYYGRVNPDGVDYAAFMPAYKKPVQPIALGRPKDNIRPLSPTGIQTPINSTQTPTYLPLPNQQPYQISPMGEPVYAQGGENMPLLGYYTNGEFIPDSSNPDSKQYLDNSEYIQNLIKRNYGTTIKYKEGGKFLGDTIERKRQQGGFSVTEQIPTWIANQQPTENPSISQSNVSTAPIQPKSVSYDKVGGYRDTIQMYVPKFNGDWSDNDIKQQWNSIPNSIAGWPVAKGQQYNDFQKPLNTNQRLSFPAPPTVQDNMQITSIPGLNYKMRFPEGYNPNTYFENGGNLSIGQQIELSDEEIIRLEKMGYKFKK